MTYQDIVSSYINTPECNTKLYKQFTLDVNNTEYLHVHRDYVIGNKLGYGDHPFHRMWEIIVESQQDNFKFMEIGVFKGQVISLIQLVSDMKNKTPKIVGVGPFDETAAGHFCKTVGSYENEIYDLFNKFKLTTDNLTLIRGLSQDQHVINKVQMLGDFDVIYIDGDHSYQGALTDLKVYSTFLKPGGILVVDDSAFYFNIETNYGKCIYFEGIKEVSDALRDFIESTPEFKLQFAIGHNTVWRKI